jgi:hypothetical protein
MSTLLQHPQMIGIVLSAMLMVQEMIDEMQLA